MTDKNQFTNITAVNMPRLNVYKISVKCQTLIKTTGQRIRSANVNTWFLILSDS